MTKQDLITVVGSKTGQNGMRLKESFSLPKKRAEKKARNITAGTTIIVPAHEVAHFKPSKSFTINK